MFIQVIQGTTRDAAGLRQRLEVWEQDLQPGAEGYLGSTGGVADDGTVVLVARFDDEDAAQANSARPEQGAWWSETAKYFDGEVTFRNCREVDQTFGGGSDEAGFVQVMQGRALDRARLAELEAQLMPKLRELRPDVLGSVRGWDGDDFVDVIYFTNEAAAREGEAAMAGQVGEEMAEFNRLIDGLWFIDLKDPWLRSP